MAHIEQTEFLKETRTRFPSKFTGCSVLDIGALDINGTNRYLFEDYSYTGVDIGPGRNVDVVCKGHEYRSTECYDVVISTECFEHDLHYPATIQNCIALTKPGGLFIFTCASTGRPEHGTSRTNTGWGSPYTDEQWPDYYKNLTEEDILAIPGFDQAFSEYRFEYNPVSSDLYFYGFRK